jgi:hypothetical protein
VKAASLLFLLLCAPLGSCRTHVQRSEADTVALEAAMSHAARAWELVQDGRVVGVVVEFEENAGERHFFSVRNPDQQELGMVDEHGRAWRFVPHSDEPEWLGTGTVLEGARRVLQLDPEAAAFEVGLETLAREASLSKGS